MVTQFFGQQTLLQGEVSTLDGQVLPQLVGLARVRVLDFVPVSEGSMPSESEGGLWNKKYVANIQNKILIDQSKANLEVKILFGKLTHHSNLKTRIMSEGNKPMQFCSII